MLAAVNYPQMNYPNMTTSGLQSSAVSLPPISSIDFRVQAAGHHSPQEVIQPLPPPPPPRQLPPLPYYHSARIPQQPEYVHQQRALYPGMQVPSPYQLVSSRIPLPSTADPGLIVTPSRHKTKEVKRRTKTGCLYDCPFLRLQMQSLTLCRTCRKRRIKVCSSFLSRHVSNVCPVVERKCQPCWTRTFGHVTSTFRHLGFCARVAGLHGSTQTSTRQSLS
jgi:hypothetical protein